MFKIIKNCAGCGYFRISNPTNYIYGGKAFCANKGKVLEERKSWHLDEDVSECPIPSWCHLEDVDTF